MANPNGQQTSEKILKLAGNQGNSNQSTRKNFPDWQKLKIINTSLGK